MSVALTGGRNEGVLLLIAAALAQYGAARLILHAQARPDGADTGRRALGQWLPIAAVAVAATLMHQPEVALSVVLGTSVACLSLVAGLISLMAPMEALPPGARIWPFLLPAALLPMMAGFSGHLSGWHALMMLVFGALVLSLWLADPDRIKAAPRAPSGFPVVGLHVNQDAGPVAAPAQSPIGAAVPAQAEPAHRSALTLLAIVLTVGGAYLAVGGTVDAANQPRPMPPGLVASIILSPLLLLPTIGTASAVAQHGQVGRAMTALVGTAMLNLCLLLPMVVLIHGLNHAAFDRGIILWPWHVPAPVSWPAMPYPMAAWRVDNVLLVVLGFSLLPIAMGRWLIGRLESFLLIIGYIIYLAAEALIALR